MMNIRELLADPPPGFLTVPWVLISKAAPGVECEQANLDRPGGGAGCLPGVSGGRG